jgi:hypothetical protein
LTMPQHRIWGVKAKSVRGECSTFWDNLRIHHPWPRFPSRSVVSRSCLEPRTPRSFLAVVASVASVIQPLGR